MRPALHLYIPHALYFKIYTTLLEVIQLMSIAGYEAYVCMCFFVYKKHYVQPSYGCRGTRVVARVCVYTARKNYLIHNLITKKYWNKNEKHEQKVGMLLQKRTDTRGVGISSMRKSIYRISPIRPRPRLDRAPLRYLSRIVRALE